MQRRLERAAPVTQSCSSIRSPIAENGQTLIDLELLSDTSRVTRFVAFLHENVNAGPIDLRRTGPGRLELRASLSLAQILSAVIESADFFPDSIHFRSRSHVQLCFARREDSPPAPEAELAGADLPGQRPGVMPPTESGALGEVPETDMVLTEAFEHLQRQLDAVLDPWKTEVGTAGARSAPDTEPKELQPQPSAPVLALPPISQDLIGDHGHEDEIEIDLVFAGNEDTIQIVARPLSSFDRLSRFMTLVASLRDVRNLTLHRFRDGVLQLSLDCDESDTLLSRLQEQQELPVDHIEVAGRTIELYIRQDAREGRFV
ncbi:MAG: hypothetical protein ACR2PL_23405 [Dehalococcoidia bacterium]